MSLLLSLKAPFTGAADNAAVVCLHTLLYHHSENLYYHLRYSFDDPERSLLSCNAGSCLYVKQEKMYTTSNMKPHC